MDCFQALFVQTENPEERHKRAQSRLKMADENDSKVLGPAAWAWLVKVQGAALDRAALGTVVAAARFLDSHRRRFTIRPYELERLLINIMTNFLDGDSESAEPLRPLLEVMAGSMGSADAAAHASVVMSFGVCQLRATGTTDAVRFFSAWSHAPGTEKAAQLLSIFLRHYRPPSDDGELGLWRLLSTVEAGEVSGVLERLVPLYTKEFLGRMVGLFVGQPWLELLVLKALFYATEALPDIVKHLQAGPRCGDRAWACLVLTGSPVEEGTAEPSAAFVREAQRYIEQGLGRLDRRLAGCIHALLPLLDNGPLTERAAHRAFELGRLDVCRRIAQEAVRGGARQCDRLRKLLYGMGCTLLRRSELEDAAWFLDACGSMGCEALASTAYKLRDYDRCRVALSEAIQQCRDRTKLPGLLDRFTCLPVGTDFDWALLAAGSLAQAAPEVIRGRCNPALAESLKAQRSNGRNEHVIYWKHRYYLARYREAPLAELLRECQQPSAWSGEMRAIWLFMSGEALPRGLHFGDAYLRGGYESLLGPSDEPIRGLRAQADAAWAEGNLLGAIKLTLASLRVLEEQKSASAGRDLFTDTALAGLSVAQLQKLSQLYRQAGVWKQTRAYARQALDLMSSMWPKPDPSHQEAFEALERASVTNAPSAAVAEPAGLQQAPAHTGPFLYAGAESDLGACWEAFAFGSPAAFTRLVHGLVRRRGCSGTQALGLLSLCSWLPFHRRDQVDRLGTALESQEVIAREHWDAAVESHATVSVAGSVLLLTYDTDGEALILANYGLQAIVYHPVAALPLAEVAGKMDAILEENRQILFGKVDRSAPELKREWWTQRVQLDKRIAELAVKVDAEWLPFLPGLFSRATLEAARLMEALNPLVGNRATPQLATFLGAFGPTPKAKTLGALADLIEGTLGVRFGSKAQAIKGLRKCYEAVFASDPQSSYEAVLARGLHNNHEAVFASDPQNIFLDDAGPAVRPCGQLTVVLDKSLHVVPWETTPSLRPVPLYRQASFWHLRRQLAQPENRAVAYILNPGGDLKTTEAFFSQRLRHHGSWSGIVGRAPQEQEFTASLTASDLFMYFGHGGGDKYVSAAKIRRLSSCAPSFLIGCSSGRLRLLGEFCPEGTFLNYLYAGCPTILVNLWDVTDRDIDKFTDAMFSKLGIWEADAKQGNDRQSGDKENGKECTGDGEEHGKELGKGQTKEHDESGSAPMELTQAVAESRTACLLKYLNGAAPIVYGLPYKWAM